MTALAFLARVGSIAFVVSTAVFGITATYLNVIEPASRRKRSHR